MTSPLRDRDLELLSAYLDNQLPAAARAQLERRLAAEPDLNEALAGLSATVRALRALPTQKIPRNFMLDATYARTGLKPSARSYGFLRLATGLVTVLFVVVLVGDVATRARQLAAPAALAPVPAERSLAVTAVAGAAVPEADALAPTEAALAEAPAVEATPETAPPGFATGGGQAGEPTGTAAPFLAASASEDAANQTAAPADLQSQLIETPTATITPAATAQSTGAPKASPTETPLAVAEFGAVDTSDAQARPAPTRSFNLLRFVEIALATLALGLAVASIWVRRRSS